MASFCALCGSKIALFGGRSLICANEEEQFCSACGEILAPMENPERGRYLLEHGTPVKPEAMKQFIAAYEARQERLTRLEPPTRPCPNCGGGMECKIKDFRIGADGKGGISLLGGYEKYYVDLYACPDCGKVEMYTANFAAVKRQTEASDAKRAAEQASTKAAEKAPIPPEREFVTYRPGQNAGEKPPWEK